MSYYKFEQNDIFTNRIKAHPRCYFLINNNKTFYNDVVPQATVDSESILDIPQGFISLYEININRLNGTNDSNLIYPYITKQGTLGSFKSISTESFQGFGYGDIISGSYPLSASISTDFYSTTLFPDLKRDRIHALKNIFNYYKPLSRHYAYETTEWNKDDQDIKLVSIPSIFFGSSIKKGSVKMNYYIEGEKVATLEDKNRNGELIQTFGQFGTAAASSSAQETGATATIQLTYDSNRDGDDIDVFVNRRFTLTDAEQTTLTFVFGDQGYPPSGEPNEAGEILVQVPNSPQDYQSGLESLATSIAYAINFSGIKITAETSDPLADLQIHLTQDIPASADSITPPSENSSDMFITDFSDPEDSSPPPQPTESEHNGKIAGVVLYNEGFVALTGSWDLGTHQEEYIINNGNDRPKWIYWGQKDTSDIDQQQDFAKSSSWDIEFLGTNYIPTITMFAHAKQGDLNHSNNPTFIDHEDRNDGDPFKIITQDMINDASLNFTQDELGKVDFQNGGALNKFVEDKDLHIANITQTPYKGADGSFEKITYISKIGIYDEDKNLIGIAKLATPVKKTESRQYTFKMKVDF